MFAWINGPGRQLRAPTPGDTNYLGAYDKFGVRARRERPNSVGEGQSADANAGGKAKVDGEEDAETLENEDTDKPSQDKSLDPAGERHYRQRPINNAEQNKDLKPYPLNNFFVSQPVLSERLREAIYHDVVEEAKSITATSIKWNIDMRRVAAVVRLKTVEKQWIQEVRFDSPPSPLHPYDDCTKNRLVFKTTTWLQKTRMRASLINLLQLEKFSTFHDGSRIS